MNVEILRGLPGSGKSHYVKSRTCRWFSADTFFQRGDDYFFEPSKIGEAHTECFSAYLDFLQETMLEDGLVIVDNTNIHASEIAPYVMVANMFDLDVCINTIMCDPYVAYKRQTHGVPGGVFWSMYQSLLSEKLPPYWKHRVLFQQE